MREILFRAKRVKDGKWVEGVAFPHDNCGAVTMFYQHPLDGSLEGCEVDPSTVGQYTGLTDKNGKKIFDGDILFCADAANEYTLPLIRDEGWGCFLDYYFGGECYDSELVRKDDWLSDCEVVGNIHDNPELLKGADK